MTDKITWTTDALRTAADLTMDDTVPLKPKFIYQMAADIDFMMGQLARAEAENAALTDVLYRKGYRKSCDISACNCGDQWNHGGHAEERLREFSDALREADVETNGVTLLNALRSLIAERDALTARAVDERKG